MGEQGLIRKISWVFPILALALVIALALASTGQTSAHRDPGACDNNAVGISIKVFRSDGTTVIKGSHTVVDDEDIKYQATLIHQGIIGACAFEDGDWDIVTPDGVSHNVLPGGVPLPQVGGVSGVPSIKSEFVDYKVTHADEIQVGGKSVVKAATNYGEDAGGGTGVNGDIHSRDGDLADSAQAGIITSSTVDHSEPGIHIEKSTNGFDADGANDPMDDIVPLGPVNWEYVVTNTGNVPITNVTVVDDIIGNPAFISGDANNDGILDVTETWIYQASGVAEDLFGNPPANTEPGTCLQQPTQPTYVNMGTASGQTISGPVTDDDPSRYCNPPEPGIHIEKSTNGFDADGANDPMDDIVPLGPVNWEYVVTNTGNVPITNVTVVDDIIGNPAFISGDANNDGILDVTETWIYQASGVAEDLFGNPPANTEPGTCLQQPNQPTYVNMGTASGQTIAGPVTDDDPSRYCNPPNADIDLEKFTLVVDVFTGDLCAQFGKPRFLTMKYTGDGDDATSHSQGSGKVNVTGDPNDATPVYVIVSEKNDGSGKIYFQGLVILGDTFIIDATLPGDSKLRAQTFVLVFLNQDVFNQGGDELQNVEFHTSCSQPLNLGDQFGSVQLVGFEDEAGDGASTPTDPIGIGVQADSPTGPEAHVGDTIIWTYVVTNTGEVALTNVTVTDNMGVVVDCPKTDLAVGEVMDCKAEGTAVAGQYANIGSVVGTPPSGPNVTDTDPSHYFANVPQINMCSDFGKPMVLTLRYTGDGPDGSSHLQAAGKVAVVGDPINTTPVRIIVGDNADLSGKIYFDGIVNLNEDFVLDASIFGDTKLSTNIYAEIFEEDGELLQTLKFHASCSQPLNLGDQFGSLLLVGFFNKDGQGGILPDAEPFTSTRTSTLTVGPFGADDTGEAIAPCDTDEWLFGGGYSFNLVDPAVPDFLVLMNGPVNPLGTQGNSWKVQIENLAGGSWHLTAFAFCVK